MVILRTILVGPKRLQIISTSAVSFEPNRDLPNSPELLILQNRKGQSAGYTLTPGMGWFFKGLPSGKRFSTYLPDGDPQRCG